MEFKGTSGKWIGKYDEGVFVINAETGNEEPVFETGCGCCTSDKLDKADALLISKAPEMLTMLKDILLSVQNSNIEADVFSIEDLEKLIKEATEM